MDNSGELDVVDIVLLVNMVLSSGYVQIGDLNGDNSLDVLDVVILVDLILNP